jgi:hypothetical protein
MGRSPTWNYLPKHLAAKKATPWFEKTPARFGNSQAFMAAACEACKT